MKYSSTPLFVVLKVWPRLLCFLLCFGLACASDETPSTKVEEKSFDQASLLKSVMEKEILPLHTGFLEQVKVLSSKTDAFSDEVSGTTLSALQEQWVSTKLAWKACELYNIGDIRSAFLHNRIEKWPISTAKIGAVLSGDGTLDEAFVSKQGSNAIGLAAVEYLIFDPEGDTSEILGAFSDRKRLQYLKGLVAYMETRASGLKQAWLDFQPSFEKATGTGLQSSKDQLVNAMVALLETIHLVKLAPVLGEGGHTGPTLAEAFRSRESLSAIEQNLKVLESCYLAGGATLGFNDYLIFMGRKDLDDLIRAQFKACFDALALINGPLETAVTDQEEEVRAFLKACKDLFVLFKVDLSSALNVTITYTDNDGD